jgi:dolichol-phosphate mannosyltransferase
MKTLSIIIPAYNEELFIGNLLSIILKVPTENLGFKKEIIVVDDGSSDNTAQVVKQYSGIQLIQQENQGKGAAVQNGITNCTGEYVLVQDADLEYDPYDYLPMLTKLIDHPNSAIYGSRILGQIRENGYSKIFLGKHQEQGVGQWLAGVVLSIWTAILYQIWITDTLTAYKIYPKNFLNQIKVKTKGFETDHELTSKLTKDKIHILEVPIHYKPRSMEEGKKIRMQDGFIALWVLLRFRFLH